MGAEKEIQELKNKIDKAKALRYKAEARLEELQKQKQQLLDELEKLNVKPEELDDEIKNLKNPKLPKNASKSALPSFCS